MLPKETFYDFTNLLQFVPYLFASQRTNEVVLISVSFSDDSFYLLNCLGHLIDGMGIDRDVFNMVVASETLLGS